jgi:small subunit ribosomal protein S20
VLTRQKGGTQLPTHSSAEKRIRTNAKANERNRFIRSTVRSAAKKVRACKSRQEAQEKLKKAIILFDKAVQKGVLHKNTAARTKSRLSRFVKNLP